MLIGDIKKNNSKMNLGELKLDPIFRENSEKALSKINALPFPNRRQEKWKYIKLSNFKKTKFHNDSKFALKTLKELNIPIGSENLIVIENGKLNKKLSNFSSIKGLEITNFSELNSDSLSYVNQYNEDYDHYFSYLNQYFLNDGLLIKISRATKISSVLKIVNLSTSNNIFINSRLNVYLEEGATLKLNQFYASTNQFSNGVINQICEYDLKKSASLEVNKFQRLKNNNNVCSEFVKQEESSSFTMNTFSLSGSLLRNDICVSVNGVDCRTELNGIFSPSSGEYMDQNTRVDHVFPDCKSYENYKGIVKSGGTGVFNGKVVVHKDAQRIEAFQKNNNVLLDDSAVVFSKPELEIYADDVKCSHGSTTGQFDEEALFYLRSRGMSRTKAIQMLIVGFINEVINKVEEEDYNSFILENILGY